MNGERASLVGCPFFCVLLSEKHASTLRNLSKKITFRRVEWVFLKILSDDFGCFRGISVPLLQIQNETS